MTDVNKVIKNLKKNNMSAFFVNKRTDVVPLLEKIIPLNAAVGSGGSVTLEEAGVIEFLRGGKFNFFDRTQPGLTDEERKEVVFRQMQCDFYFTSSNAITEDGCLYNVDGRGNRVAAIVYGPRNIIVVAGVNKIVVTLEDAVKRVKTIAAPKNCVRLNSNTYCQLKGQCKSLNEDGSSNMTDGCGSDTRICCHYLVTGFQKVKDRIKVILVNESLGY